jgi:hypothetical protein
MIERRPMVVIEHIARASLFQLAVSFFFPSNSLFCYSRLAKQQHLILRNHARKHLFKDISDTEPFGAVQVDPHHGFLQGALDDNDVF